MATTRIDIYPLPQAKRTEPVREQAVGLFSEETPSFEDVLDTINPLQHLPVVSNIYRSESDDSISIFSRLAGGFLFGGPIGLLAAAVNAGVEAATGSDIGEHVLAMLDENLPSASDVASRYANTEQLA